MITSYCWSEGPRVGDVRPVCFQEDGHPGLHHGHAELGLENIQWGGPVMKVPESRRHEYWTPVFDFEEDDSYDMPSVFRAADRVLAFVGNFGDGHVEDLEGGPPLHARDLEVLAQFAKNYSSAVV